MLFAYYDYLLSINLTLSSLIISFLLLYIFKVIKIILRSKKRITRAIEIFLYLKKLI